VHRHGSIAILEWFWRSMKDECFRQFPVPLSLTAMRRELAAYLDWYHRHRPHQALGRATPAEVIAGKAPARHKRRLEPRPKMPLERDGPPGARRVRKRVAHLALVVDEEVGRGKAARRVVAPRRVVGSRVPPTALPPPKRRGGQNRPPCAETPLVASVPAAGGEGIIVYRDATGWGRAWGCD
jgi:hypothetical protein